MRRAPVTPAADLPASCHFASDKDKVSVTILAGWRRFFTHAVAHVRQGVPGSMSGVSHRNCDETHQTFHPGHQPSPLAGRRFLAALAVSGCRSLRAARHAAGAVVVSVRSAGSVPAAVALVAAVGLQLPQPHRPGAAASPPAAGVSRFAAHRERGCVRCSAAIKVGRFRQPAIFNPCRTFAPFFVMPIRARVAQKCLASRILPMEVISNSRH